MTGFDRGAREHFTAGAGNVKAIALIVGGPVDRMLANFFIGMRRAVTPIRLFDDEPTALNWLAERSGDAQPDGTPPGS